MYKRDLELINKTCPVLKYAVEHCTLRRKLHSLDDDIPICVGAGLVDHMEESGSCEDVALSFAREISAAGPIALRMAKLAINAGYDTSLDIGLQFESSCYAQLLPTRDRLEGLAAFAEKRQPKFTGQ